MNIKQAESLSGVSRQNIRFYEKQRLLSPTRNPENDYREYTEKDIEALKWIRAMRMLDMPLEDIRQVLSGAMTLAQAAAEQQARLEQQREKLDGAIRFCGVLCNEDMQALSADGCLARMNEGEGLGYFQQWKQDFLAVAAAEHRRVFTFTPDTPITNSREFTDALLAYAKEEDVDLVITAESMYPVFTIDDIEYTAYRDYRASGGSFAIPTATVHCEMTHPEDYLPPVSKQRAKWLRMFNAAWPGLIVLVLLALSLLPELGSWEGWVLLASLLAVLAAQVYLNWRFHFNDKTK